MFAFIDLLYTDDTGFPAASQGIADEKAPIKDGWIRMSMDEYLKLAEQLKAEQQATAEQEAKAEAQAVAEAELATETALTDFLVKSKPTLDELTEHVTLLTVLIQKLLGTR